MQQYEQEYDLVVLGAGIGGLTHAALMARCGFRVCVLEMDGRIGGYLAGFRRKKFRFDTALHWLNQCGEAGLVSKIFKMIGNDYPRVSSQKEIRRYLGINFNYLLTNQPDKLKNKWIEEFPEDEKGIEHFFKESRKLGEAFVKLANRSRTIESMSLIEKSKFGIGMLFTAFPFIKYLSYSGDEGIQKGLNKFFTSEKLKSVFCSESDLLSCMVPIGWAYVNDYQNPPEGGSQVFAEWLAHVIEQSGGKILLRAKVNGLQAQGGKVSAVHFKHYKEQKSIAAHYFCSSIDDVYFQENVLPKQARDHELIKRMKNANLYASSVNISLALNCPVEQFGLGEELIFITEDGIERKQHSQANPQNCAIAILPVSLRDKSMCLPEHGQISIHISADLENEDFWKTELNENGERIRGEAYKNYKEDFAKIIVSRIEDRLRISLQEHILFMDVATPFTLQRYTGNYKGSIMGFRPGKENMKAKIAGYNTVYDNLYRCGQNAELGGGVPIAVKAAANAALLILQKEKHGLAKLFAQYLDGKISIEDLLKQANLTAYANQWVRNPTPAEAVEKSD